MKSFNNNGANLNSSLQHLDRTGFAGNTGSRQATVQQQPESTWSGRNARELSGTATGISGVHGSDTFEAPGGKPATSAQQSSTQQPSTQPSAQPSTPPSALLSSMRLVVKDHFNAGASMPSLAGLGALLKKGGLRADTVLSQEPGLAEPLGALAARYSEGDVRRDLLTRAAAGDQSALQTLLKKRAS